MQAEIRNTLTGLILAGGQSRRMGGVDKAWLDLDGVPMVLRAAQRLAPQVAGLLVSANRDLERYAAHDLPVVTDRIAGFAGPLAGWHAALRAAATPFVVSVPCDAPFFPLDLVARFMDATGARTDTVAIAADAQRRHPVFALLPVALADDLEAFLAGDERKVERWLARHPLVEVRFDDADAFRNINTPEELAASSKSP